MADYTWASVLGMYLMMATFVVVTAWALVRAIRNGSVSMDETPKYRMLDDDGLLPEERESRTAADPAAQQQKR